MKQKLYLRLWKALWVSFFEHAAVNHPADTKERCGEAPAHLPALQSARHRSALVQKLQTWSGVVLSMDFAHPGSWVESKQFKMQKQSKFMSIFWHLCRKACGISTFPFSDRRVKSFACLSFTAGCGVNQLLFRILELLMEKHDRSLRLYFPACHNYPHCFGVFGP